MREVFHARHRWLKTGLGGATVFCNPPYGRAIGLWVRKAYQESRKADTTVVMLLPARTDTAWFHDYIYHRAEIRFIRGRLKFGDARQSAPFPSMVVIFKKKLKIFIKNVCLLNTFSYFCSDKQLTINIYE